MQLRVYRLRHFQRIRRRIDSNCIPRSCIGWHEMVDRDEIDAAGDLCRMGRIVVLSLVFARTEARELVSDAAEVETQSREDDKYYYKNDSSTS